MSELILPADEEVAVGLGPNGTLKQKRARDIAPGDFVWCFEVESYRPVLAGHFTFTRVDRKPETHKRPAFTCRWFNQQDGPEVNVPTDWIVAADGPSARIDSQRQFAAFAHPGHLHDYIPLALGFELFSNGFRSRRLTEPAAYFLGAFATRPQCYVVGSDTWGIFGVHFNPAGEFGMSRVAPTTMSEWLESHERAAQRLAELAWGRGNFLLERRGKRVGLPNIPVPPGHTGDKLLRRSSAVGFAIHGPIARGEHLNSDGRPSSKDLRVIEFWYACLRAHLLERATQSVRKAFLLGALDTVSNADKNRGSIGLDWPDGFAGEFPTYGAVHAVGRSMLDTFETGETGNPRATRGRLRGRIPRCRILEEVQEVGFLSDLRLARALKYEPAAASAPLAAFPTPNALSVCMDVAVHSSALPSGFGSSERDLTGSRLFRSTAQSVRDFVSMVIEQENLYAVSSLPLGWRRPGPAALGSLAGRSRLPLARSGWEAEAFHRLTHLNEYLSAWSGAQGRCPEADAVFEYLIAVLMTRLDGCRQAWVVPRHEDQGVDVGASFDTGATELGSMTGLIQAKLQTASPVGRRVIDQLRGSLNREEGLIGWVVTNSTFTAMATKSAEQDYPTIRLVPGQKLLQLLVAHGVGFFERRVQSGRRVYMDLTFFEALRDLTASGANRKGRIHVVLDRSGTPIFSPDSPPE